MRFYRTSSNNQYLSDFVESVEGVEGKICVIAGGILLDSNIKSLIFDIYN